MQEIGERVFAPFHQRYLGTEPNMTELALHGEEEDSDRRGF